MSIWCRNHAILLCATRYEVGGAIAAAFASYRVSLGLWRDRHEPTITRQQPQNDDPALIALISDHKRPARNGEFLHPRTMGICGIAFRRGNTGHRVAEKAQEFLLGFTYRQ